MKFNDSNEQTRNALLLGFGVVSLAVLATLAFWMPRRIQHADYERWEYAATNTIPTLLRQNQIADALLERDDVEREIEDYRAGGLQAGFHIPKQKLAALERALEWQTLSNRYLTNVSPETELYQVWRRQEARAKMQR